MALRVKTHEKGDSFRGGNLRESGQKTYWLGASTVLRPWSHWVCRPKTTESLGLLAEIDLETKSSNMFFDTLKPALL